MSNDRGLLPRRPRREPSHGGTRRSRRASAALLLGAIASIAALALGIALLLPRPVEPSAPDAGSGPVATAPAASTASPAPSATAPAGVGTSDASITARAAAVDPPVAVRVPSVGLQLEVVPVGVRSDGQMDVPEFVGELGWYRYGPAPGAEAGSAVLAAHVDSEVGRAPMAEVLDAAAGDAVEVSTAAGSTLRYRITAIDQISKDTMPLEALFARDGDPVLRLITCGGEWDAAAGAYEDNIVVTAVPVGG